MRSDREIVEAYINGEPWAIKTTEELISSGFARWRHRFGQETDDILSDARYELGEALRSGKFEFRCALKSYVGRIISTTCLDYLRVRKRVKIVDPEMVALEETAPNPEDEMASQQLSRIVFRVLRRVPKQCRQMWRMQLQDGMPLRKIGEILEIPEKNVRWRLWKCRERAKEIRENILARDKQLLGPDA